VIYVLYFLHVVVCLFLILVVLLQQGKGADLSVFGGGSTMAAFGARGATTLLHKLTVTSFILFTVTTLGIAIMQSRATGSSVMSGEPAAAPTAPAPAPPTGATAPVLPAGETAPAPAAPATPPATGPQGATAPATGPAAPPAAPPAPPPASPLPGE
jgi:preprotein translocase subunit SecG